MQAVVVFVHRVGGLHGDAIHVRLRGLHRDGGRGRGRGLGWRRGRERWARRSHCGEQSQQAEGGQGPAGAALQNEMRGVTQRKGEGMGCAMVRQEEPGGGKLLPRLRRHGRSTIYLEVYESHGIRKIRRP